MRIKSIVRLISYLLIMSMLVVAVPVSSWAATSSELQNEKDQIDKEKKQAEEEKKKEQAALDEASDKADAIEGDMEGVSEEIEEVDESIVSTMASIDIMEEEIEAKKQEIEETTEEYEEAKETEEEQYEAMKLRIRFMYEKGEFTYMQLLVESKNFSDMVNKAEYIEKLYDYDRKLLLEYQAAKEATYELKLQLEDEKDELDSSLLELTEEKIYLEDILAQKKSEYKNFESQLARAKEEVSSYKARVANVNKQIKDLEAKSSAKQKEIDTAKRNEEAARNSSSSGSSGGTKKSYLSPGNFSGSTGSKIAQYACQFVGNPYVYGGTSLTSGCDCSGFVWRVYKDNGYTIPRLGMKNIGVGVSYENAQPGDIFCYAGHVALYIGNGQIVHASTKKTGIKISNATYKTIIAIRRVV